MLWISEAQGFRKPIDHAYRLILSRRASQPVDLELLFPDNADHDYLNSRNFSLVHKVLFGLGGGITLSALATLVELDPSIDVNAGDAMGMTPLSWAADMNNANSIQELLDIRSDPNIADIRQMTPLMRTSDPTCMELLLNAGANIDAGDQTNQTALFFSAKSPLCVKLLLDRGASINLVENSAGFTALHASVHDKRTGVVRLLLEHHADYMIPAKDGSSLVHTALKVSDGPTLDVLAEAELSLLTPDSRNGEGLSITDLAREREQKTPGLSTQIRSLISSLGPSASKEEADAAVMSDAETQGSWWPGLDTVSTIM